MEEVSECSSDDLLEHTRWDYSLGDKDKDKSKKDGKITKGNRPDSSKPTFGTDKDMFTVTDKKIKKNNSLSKQNSLGNMSLGNMRPASASLNRNLQQTSSVSLNFNA